MSAQMGAWAFVLGLVIAIIAGFVAPNSGPAALVLGVLGIIVGLLNISEREASTFLISSIAFVVAFNGLAGVLSVIPGIGGFLPSVLNYLVIFVAPGAAVVAIKALFSVARQR